MSLAKFYPSPKNKNEWRATIEDIVQIITKRLPNAKVYLFGSLVRMNNNAESDLDISVVVPDEDYNKNLYLELRKSLPGEIAMDLVIMPSSYFEERKEMGGLCYEIHNYGVELYPKWKWDA